MKRKFWCFILPLFCYLSCATDDMEMLLSDSQKSGNLLSHVATKNLQPKNKKMITGTFVDFWCKGDWSQEAWIKHFKEMKDLGVNTVIVQDVCHNKYAWLPLNASVSFISRDGLSYFPDALGRLMVAADRADIDVYVGLYFDSSYWENQTNISWLRLHAERCKTVASAVYDLYNKNKKESKWKSFAGWYIPHEPEPYAYNSSDKMEIFRNNFVDVVSGYVRSLGSNSNKPVAIAAFFNSLLTPPGQLHCFMSSLAKCNLQVFMLQDGVGVGHASLDELPAYYDDAILGLFTSLKEILKKPDERQKKFWIDIETFTRKNGVSRPAKFERVREQLELAASMLGVDKVVSFQYYRDMCHPQNDGDSVLAIALRDAYRAYLTDSSQASLKAN